MFYRARVNKNTRIRKKNLKGFTLIEIILIIVLLGIIVGMSAPFIATTLDAWIISNTQRNLIFNARLSLNRMVRELRQAANINSANSTYFNFTDLDNATVCFRQNAASLLRNSDELSSLLVSPGGLNFTYYNETGNITTNIALIRRVGLDLNLMQDNSTINMRSYIRLRNIK